MNDSVDCPAVGLLYEFHGDSRASVIFVILKDLKTQIMPMSSRSDFARKPDTLPTYNLLKSTRPVVGLHAGTVRELHAKAYHAPAFSCRGVCSGIRFDGLARAYQDLALALSD